MTAEGPRALGHWCRRSIAAQAAIPLALILLVPLGTPGCLMLSPGRSLVAQGRAYLPGEPLYDRFFSELYQAQLAMAAVPDEESRYRRLLAGQLDALGDSPTALASAVDERVQQLRVGGVRVRLVLQGDPGDENAQVRVDTSGSVNSEQRVFLAAIEAAVRGELALMSRLSVEKERLNRLGSMADGLASNVDNQFRTRGLSKRAEVRKNVRDAQALVPLMLARVQEVSSAARQLTKKLEAVASTLPAHSVTDSATPEEPAAIEPATRGKEGRSPPDSRPSRAAGDRKPPPNVRKGAAGVPPSKPATMPKAPNSAAPPALTPTSPAGADFDP